MNALNTDLHQKAIKKNNGSTAAGPAKKARPYEPSDSTLPTAGSASKQRRMAHDNNQDSIAPSDQLHRLLAKLQSMYLNHKQRKLDKLAIRQLMQLDDALLKDMGLSRTELMAIRTGSLPFDALIKRDIVEHRDLTGSSTSRRH